MSFHEKRKKFTRLLRDYWPIIGYNKFKYLFSVSSSKKNSWKFKICFSWKHPWPSWAAYYWLSKVYLKLIRYFGRLLVCVRNKLTFNLFFSFLFQAGPSPCTSGGKGKGKSILGSCIARTNSEEELQELAKRPISPGHRGTTWNGNGKLYNLMLIFFVKLFVGKVQSLFWINIRYVSSCITWL